MFLPKSNGHTTKLFNSSARIFDDAVKEWLSGLNLPKYSLPLKQVILIQWDWFTLKNYVDIHDIQRENVSVRKRKNELIVSIKTLGSIYYWRMRCKSVSIQSQLELKKVQLHKNNSMSAEYHVAIRWLK
jgi:hypothetical protein